MQDHWDISEDNTSETTPFYCKNQRKLSFSRKRLLRIFSNPSIKILLVTLSRTLTFQKNLFYLVDWKPFKNDGKCFYFVLKAFFVLEIFRFLSQYFCHVGKTVWLERLTSKVNLKIYNVTIWFTNNSNTHITQYLTK